MIQLSALSRNQSKPCARALELPPLARICRGKTGRAHLLCPRTSDVNLFRYRKGIIDLDPEVSDGTFYLLMPQ